jgi:hypothetical protein
MTFCAMAAAAACGGDDDGDDDQATPDAAPPQRKLEIVTPPGDQVGLAAGEAETLRVRYLEDGAPIAGAEVSFVLVVGPGSDPAGSTLSATRAPTGADGVAEVTVTAGATPTMFRVRAEAPAATPVEIFVAVSNAGFVALTVTPRHEGPRPDGDFAGVELRLYPGAPCALLDATAPQPSPLPPRSTALDTEASWPELPAGAAYTLLVWGASAGDTVLADTCIELTAEQAPPGMAVALEPVLTDRPVHLAATGYTVTTQLDLTPVSGPMLGAGIWGQATCPLGGAQLVLDWSIDALDGGDPLDGEIVAPGAAATALAARRARDAQGCATATLPGAGSSLDALVEPALVTETTTPHLADKAAWIVQDQLELVSALVPGASPGVCSHELRLARRTEGNGEIVEDLAASARPIVHVDGVACALGDGPAPALTVAGHGFTLRLGAFLRHVLAVLPAAPGALATELVAAGGGCAALSAAVCVAASLPADCLVAACATALPALDAALAAQLAELDGVGIDLAWSGAATATDVDLDLVAESLAGGLWSATLTSAGGAPTAVTGAFTAEDVE